METIQGGKLIKRRHYLWIHGIQIFVALLRQYIELMLLHHALNYGPLKMSTEFRKEFPPFNSLRSKNSVY